MYIKMTGMKSDIDLVRIIDDADHVKASICPGISITKMLLADFFINSSILEMIRSGWAVYRLRAVRMAPLGPS
jgi:hypothetical protein